MSGSAREYVADDGQERGARLADVADVQVAAAVDGNGAKPGDVADVQVAAAADGNGITAPDLVEVQVAIAADGNGVTIPDLAAVPFDAPPDLLYRHKPRLRHAARQLLRQGDIIFTLAERDIRAQYKQQILGISWALINPVVSLVVFTIVFNRVKSFHVAGQPYILFLYIGIISWGFFSGAVAGASGSLVSNKLMMAKTHFPRECFPLAQVLESAFTSTMALVPLFILFALKGFAPKPATLWFPVYMAVEIPFAIGVALVVSSVIVQMRDLNQVVSLFLPLAMLMTPVIWPLTKIPAEWRPVYCFFNPVAPVVDGLRGSMLENLAPDWPLLLVGLCGSLVYLIGGYSLFKRLEVGFADLT
jgi:ABC-type polysaccharide/polyol phosphate export permease